jgi:hypothetical protein
LKYNGWIRRKHKKIEKVTGSPNDKEHGGCFQEESERATVP